MSDFNALEEYDDYYESEDPEPRSGSKVKPPPAPSGWCCVIMFIILVLMIIGMFWGCWISRICTY